MRTQIEQRRFGERKHRNSDVYKLGGLHDDFDCGKCHRKAGSYGDPGEADLAPGSKCAGARVSQKYQYLHCYWCILADSYPQFDIDTHRCVRLSKRGWVNGGSLFQ